VSITFPKGFRAAGVPAGIKTPPAKDVAVVMADGPAASLCAAARFTTNRFTAAPVVVSRRHLQNHNGVSPRVVVLNSGGANACTGQAGIDDAEATASAAASALGLSPAEVLVCSTGLIGERLPMASLLAGVRAGIGQLAGDAAAGQAAAEAIMTTDTKPKQATAEQDGWRLGGMAKGAGMMAPELATMLVVLTTDALLDQPLAEQALAQACTYSFDRTDTDGCMSTNDTVILLANGASGVWPEPATFVAELTSLCQDLARQLVQDAEGAAHDITIRVDGAATEAGALAVARAIGRSNLFKTAIAGNDPNWGRVVSAAGTVPAAVAAFEPSQVDVVINGVMVCQGGAAGQARGLVDLSERAVLVEVHLGAGAAQAQLLTNDLTAEYVHINADYSS